MYFDPAYQEYIPENPAVDRTTAQIVGSRNPGVLDNKAELGAEVASGARNLKSLTYSELMQLQDLDLGHSTNKMVISEIMARERDPIDDNVYPEATEPSLDVDPSLAESDRTASEAFKSDFKDEFRDERKIDRKDDFKHDRRSNRR